MPLQKPLYPTPLPPPKNSPAGGRYSGKLPASRTRVAIKDVLEGTTAARQGLSALRQVWCAAVQRHQASRRYLVSHPCVGGVVQRGARQLARGSSSVHGRPQASCYRRRVALIVEWSVDLFLHQDQSVAICFFFKNGSVYAADAAAAICLLSMPVPS